MGLVLYICQRRKVDFSCGYAELFWMGFVGILDPSHKHLSGIPKPNEKRHVSSVLFSSESTLFHSQIPQLTRRIITQIFVMPHSWLEGWMKRCWLRKEELHTVYLPVYLFLFNLHYRVTVDIPLFFFFFFPLRKIHCCFTCFSPCFTLLIFRNYALEGFSLLFRTWLLKIGGFYVCLSMADVCVIPCSILRVLDITALTFGLRLRICY